MHKPKGRSMPNFFGGGLHRNAGVCAVQFKLGIQQAALGLPTRG